MEVMPKSLFIFSHALQCGHVTCCKEKYFAFFCDMSFFSVHFTPSNCLELVEAVLLEAYLRYLCDKCEADVYFSNNGVETFLHITKIYTISAWLVKLLFSSSIDILLPHEINHHSMHALPWPCFPVSAFLEGTVPHDQHHW